MILILDIVFLRPKDKQFSPRNDFLLEDIYIIDLKIWPSSMSLVDNSIAFSRLSLI